MKDEENSLSNSNEPKDTTELAESPVCRVCHGESEPGRELYYPCKCDGTIKYVHQDCLTEWIKHSRQKTPRCELCGQPFRFQNIYKEGAPLYLTLYDLLLELIPRAIQAFKNIAYICIGFFLWLVFLPVCTNSWMRMNMCLISDPDIRQCAQRIYVSLLTIEGISSSIYGGVLNLCIILSVNFVGFEICRAIYKESVSLERNKLQRQIQALNLQCFHNLNQLEGKWNEMTSLTLHTLHNCVCTEMRLRESIGITVGEELSMMREEIEGVRMATTRGGWGHWGMMTVRRLGVGAPLARMRRYVEGEDSEGDFLLPPGRRLVHILRLLQHLPRLTLPVGNTASNVEGRLSLLHAQRRAVMLGLREEAEMGARAAARVAGGVAWEGLFEFGDVAAPDGVAGGGAGVGGGMGMRDEGRGEGRSIAELKQVLKRRETLLETLFTLQTDATSCMVSLKTMEETVLSAWGSFEVAFAGLVDGWREQGLVLEALGMEVLARGLMMQRYIEEEGMAVATPSENDVGRERSHDDNVSTDRVIPVEEKIAISQGANVSVEDSEDDEEWRSVWRDVEVEDIEEDAETYSERKSDEEGRITGGDLPNRIPSPAPLVPAPDSLNGEQRDQGEPVEGHGQFEEIGVIREEEEERHDNVDPGIDQGFVDHGIDQGALDGEEGEMAVLEGEIGGVAVGVGNVQPRGGEDGIGAVRVEVAMGPAEGGRIFQFRIDLSFVAFFLLVLAYVILFLNAALGLPASIGYLVAHSYFPAPPTPSPLTAIVDSFLSDSEQTHLLVRMLDIPSPSSGATTTPLSTLSLYLAHKMRGGVFLALGYLICTLALVLLGGLYVIRHCIAMVTTHAPILHNPALLVANPAPNQPVQQPALQAHVPVPHAPLPIDPLLLHPPAPTTLVNRITSPLVPYIKICLAGGAYMLLLPCVVTMLLSSHIHPPLVRGVVKGIQGWFKDMGSALVSGKIFVEWDMNVVGMFFKLVEWLATGSPPPILPFLTLYLISLPLIYHSLFIFHEVGRALRGASVEGLFPPNPIFMEAAGEAAGGGDRGMALVQNVSISSFSLLLKNFLLVLGGGVGGALFFFLLPVLLAPHLCLLPAPVQLNVGVGEGSGADVSLPLELLLTQLALPLILDRLDYGGRVRGLVRGLVGILAPLLSLEDFLSPLAFPRPNRDLNAEARVAVAERRGEEGGVGGIMHIADPNPQPATASPAYLLLRSALSWLPLPLRLPMLILSLLCTLSALHAYLFYLPLLVGRGSVGVYNKFCATLPFPPLPPQTDLLHYPLGLCICMGVGQVGFMMGGDVYRGLREGGERVGGLIMRWGGQVGKVSVATLLFFSVPPFLLGYALHVLAFHPLVYIVGEGSWRGEVVRTHYARLWAVGLVCLKLTLRCVLSGVFGDLPLRDDLELLLIRGVRHFDFNHYIHNILTPIMLPLLDLLAPPYFLSRLVGMYVGNYLGPQASDMLVYVWRSLLARYAYVAWLCMRCFGQISMYMVKGVVKLHNEIRDQRYLLTTQLANRD